MYVQDVVFHSCMGKEM